MKKILYISHTSELGGAEISFIDLITNIHKHYKDEFDITVLCPKEGELTKRLQKNNVSIIFLSALNNANYSRFKHPIKWFSNVFKIYNFLKKNKFDLIHLNSVEGLKDCFLPAKLLKIPLIIHIRNIQRLNYIERALLKRVRKIIAISNAVKENLLKQISNISVVVIYNGISISNSQFQISNPKSQTVGMFSRISQSKGQKIFIESAKIVLEQRKDVNFIIAGDTSNCEDKDFPDYLKSLVKKFEIEKNIIFYGFYSDIIGLMNNTDIIVIPSLIPEGLGRVALEGMMMGKPIIATNLGGLNEVVINGETGFLIPPNNPEILAEKIIYLLDNVSICKEMGDKGRKRVETIFSIDRMIREIIGLYT